jgi:hypothetical protein
LPPVVIVILFVLLTAAAFAQGTKSASQTEKQTAQKPQVNWLYGAYVPKEVPLVSLSHRERFHLYVAQTYISVGIYAKTAVLSGIDQFDASPKEWGGGSRGFAKRVASTHAQSVIQNSLSALGNGIVGFEPRYDHCRCEGGWHRARHAIVRNVLTYDRTEHHWRPQLPLYISSASTGMISGAWLPDRRSAAWRAAHNVLTQLAVGAVAHLVGEFAPDVKRVLFKRKEPR